MPDWAEPYHVGPFNQLEAILNFIFSLVIANDFGCVSSYIICKNEILAVLLFCFFKLVLFEDKG
jgi:hypothetical protein